MSCTAGSAFSHFLTIGIDKGYQPNEAQHITRADLPYAVVNNDAAALGNSALFDLPLMPAILRMSGLQSRRP